MNRISSFLSLAIVLILVPTLGTAWGNSIRNSSQNGTISGYVVCESGSLTDGLVQLIKDGDILNDCYVYDDHRFQFEGVLPGSYELSFFDINEIPVGLPMSVTVTAGKISEVTLTIPYTFTGMQCDELMEMGWDGYCDAIDEAFLSRGYEYSWLSEVGMDRVAQTWGDCKRSNNDDLMVAFPPEWVEEINSIRSALENFEWNFYYVAFFGGTGAFHNGGRTVVGREIFIGEVLVDLTCGSDEFFDVDSDEIEDAEDILDDVLDISDQFDPELYTYDEENFRIALDEFETACEELVELASDLDEGYMVAIADYVKLYTEMDLYL